MFCLIQLAQQSSSKARLTNAIAAAALFAIACPHMLRHAAGYYLASKGHDTKAIQAYLRHRSIQHTVRYTELAPGRFNDFWKD